MDYEAEGLLEKDPYWGVLGTGERETDYQVAGGTFRLPKPRGTFHMYELEYHQPEVSSVSCTLHGALGNISDLTGYKFTLEQRKEMWAEAIRRGAKEGWGWYTARAVDLVREYAAKYIGEKFMSFILELNDVDAFDTLDAGYSLVCSFRGNRAYNEDKLDGILDSVSCGETTYGHCVRMVPTVERDEYELVIDNYITTKGKKNRYKVSRAKLEALIKNGVFMKNAYVFAYERDFANMEVESAVPIWAVKSWQKAVEKGLIKFDDDPNKNFADGYVEKMLIQMGGLTKAEGGVSLARFLVASDRLGIL